MAFTLRRPFAVTNALKQFSKPSTSTPLCAAFHSAPPKQSIFKLSQSRPFILQNAFRNTSKSGSWTNFSAGARSITQQSAPAVNPTASGNMTQRLLYGAGLFGATIFATNMIFNRETREDGGMPPFERKYLNDTFMHTGLGLGIIAVAARSLHASGWSYRLMSANPWLVFGVGLAGSIGFMMGTFATPPDNYVAKYGLWTGFNLTQAAILSPLMFLQPALLARAGLYTVGLMGSIAFVGATAKQEKYLYLGGPLLAGVAVVALSGLAPLVLPATATRTLMFTENLWLYGGLAVFGGITLYDVQKILYRARMAEQGAMRKDVVNESVSLELDFLNIFIRLVQILGMSGNRRK